MSGATEWMLLAPPRGPAPPCPAAPPVPWGKGTQPGGPLRSRLLVASAGAHAAGLAAFLLLQWSTPAPEPGPMPVEMLFEAPPADAGSQQIIGQAPGTTETLADADASTLPQPSTMPAMGPASASPQATAIAVEEAAPVMPSVESAPTSPLDAAEVAPSPPETLPLPPALLAEPPSPSPEPSSRPADATTAVPIPMPASPAEPRREAPKAARPTLRPVAKRPERRQEAAAASPIAGVPAPVPAGNGAASVVAARSPALPADAGPVLITNPRFRVPPAPPAYPQLAREQGQEGEAVIRARLDREGNPEEVILQASSGFPMLDRAALAAVRRWAFEPGRRGGEPVIAWVQIPVRFDLR